VRIRRHRVYHHAVTLAKWLRGAVSVLAGACTKPTPTTFTTGGDDVPTEPGRTYRWSFDDAALGALPEPLINVLGDWRIEVADGAPSKVLRQTGSYKNPDFPRVVVKGLTFTDLDLRVRCRPETGDTDRACGLMFRLKDSDNYYVTRANALEGNVRLYRVVDGDRKQFASADLDVIAGRWHTLEATARGTRLTVSWDGKQVIDATDDTFARGKIGLWTKADSVTAFDDLEAVAR
jgi:3-keto-disaccharide hydrolase